MWSAFLNKGIEPEQMGVFIVTGTTVRWVLIDQIYREAAPWACSRSQPHCSAHFYNFAVTVLLYMSSQCSTHAFLKPFARLRSMRRERLCFVAGFRLKTHHPMCVSRRTLEDIWRYGLTQQMRIQILSLKVLASILQVWSSKFQLLIDGEKSIFAARSII
jgi:hypothetical protein